MTSQSSQPYSSYPRPTRSPSPNLPPGSTNSHSASAPRLPPKDNRTGSASATGSRSGPSHNNNNNIGSSDFLSIPPSTSSFSNNLSRYTSSSEADELARAVRDSVQIRSSSPSHQPSSTQHVHAGNQQPHRRSPSPRMPAPAMPSVNFAQAQAQQGQPDFSAAGGGVKGNWEPGHAYSHSSPDMAHATQSSMPRQAVMNPFEEDEVEQPQVRAGGKHRSPEGAGVVAPSRQKFSRAATATTPSSISQTPLLATSPDGAPAPAPKHRVRRALSTDSYGVDTGAMRELTAGQKKAAAEKKGSKHADIIDRWDPTGLGDARPYDAAAPSRNIGNTKAPMKVFSNSTLPAEAITTTTTATQGRKTGTIQEDDTPRAQVAAAAAPPPASIPAASARQPINRRVSGGGLTGQYSTSVPSGGGYFPDVKAPQDEASLARMEREKEKEMKQRALKAAWGIDEPEPWEDFGVSPNDTTGTLANDGLAPEAYAKPLRSPGLRLGNSRADSFSKEAALPSPTGENAPISTAELRGSAAAGPPGAGVKRTKSLMQKFKTMRENKNVPFRSASPSKAVLPSSPSNEFPLASPNENDEYDPSGATNPFLSPHKARTMVLVPPRGPGGADQFDDAVEVIDTPPVAGFGRSDTEKEFVFVDPPSSKPRGKKGSTSPTRAEQRGIPPVPALPASISQRGLTFDLAPGTGGGGGRTGLGVNGDRGERERSTRPADRAKYLPPPPVGQVMPDFADIDAYRRPSVSEQGGGLAAPGFGAAEGEEKGSGMRRKTSVVKKIKERIK